MKNEVSLNFTIANFDDITHAEITQRLGITPEKIYIKGTRINPKRMQISKTNRWLMSSGLHKYSSVEEHLNALLDIIESKIDLFKPFCDRYYCEFSCAIFIRDNNDESTPSIHLNSRYNKLIERLNIEFDVDLYCLPNQSQEI